MIVPIFKLQPVFRLFEIDRFAWTEFFTSSAFPILKVGAVDRINDRDARNCLREGVIDCRTVSKPQIKLGWDLLPWAFLDAGSTTSA